MMVFTGLALMLIIAACSNGTDGSEKENSDSNGSKDTTNENVESEGIDKSDWPEKVRFAAAGVEGLEELHRKFGALQEVFEELMGVEFELFSLSNRTVSSTAVEYGQVDIVLSGPSEYVLTKLAEPNVKLLGGLERENYYTVFIVRTDSGFDSLDDLVGHTIAMKDSGSTSGHIGPSAILIDEGFDLDKDFDIQLLGDASLEALRSGDVDAMADGVKHYHTLVEMDGEGVWKLLYEGPPLPQDPFVAGPSLPDSFTEEFKRVLFENEEKVLAAILSSEDNDKYEDGKLVNLEDSDYDLMRETYKTLGLKIEE